MDGLYDTTLIKTYIQFKANTSYGKLVMNLGSAIYEVMYKYTWKLLQNPQNDNSGN